MDYESLSDFQLNEAVGSILIGKHEWHEGCWNVADGFKYCICCPHDRSVALPNYCNNPSDAWPIIVENKISLSPKGINWVAWCFYQECEDSNPLRAAMIVYLKMQESK